MHSKTTLTKLLNGAMCLNINKFMHLCFTCSSSMPLNSLALNGITIQASTQYKYLGVHLITNMSWDVHVDKTKSSANHSLGNVRRNFKSVPSPLCHAYRPKLEYLLVIWHAHHSLLTNAFERNQTCVAQIIIFKCSRFYGVPAMKS